jgi:hypothetical protein
VEGHPQREQSQRLGQAVRVLQEVLLAAVVAVRVAVVLGQLALMLQERIAAETAVLDCLTLFLVPLFFMLVAGAEALKTAMLVYEDWGATAAAETAVKPQQELLEVQIQAAVVAEVT